MKKILDNKVVKASIMLFRVLVMIAIVCIVSLIIVQRVFNNNFAIGGIRIFTVVTESMVPKYNVFDVVMSKEVDPATIKVGDDVVYLGKKDDFADKIITHQVIQIDDGLIFHTKGIANTDEDPTITQDQIYGVVFYKSRILSAISRVVNNPYGFYFLIFVPIAVLVALEIIDRIKGDDDEDEEEN